MEQPSRRKALKQLGLGSLALSSSALTSLTLHEVRAKSLKGNINHSVCRWTYGFLSVEELCQRVKKIGFAAIDLVGPSDWPVLKKYDIYSSMCNGAELNLVDGWNHKEFHAKLTQRYLEHIDLVAKAGYRNLICFSGNRRGMDDETGLKNCEEGLETIMSQAEKRGVMIQMELLNSKVDHKDYMCDLTPWGVELVKRVGSPNFKLLYDIYHMQIDEGDVIRTLTDNKEYIGHYHTGGVPGRHIIDESQELYYPAIMRGIAKTGFSGYVAQEFIPEGPSNEDKVKQLEKAIKICDI